ncbi:MAG: hypothetical protein NC212_03160 [Staphylococcus sp.]|nr:hypothetical protein [Staphylococcus sp.]
MKSLTRLNLLPILSLMALLSGCFTGVEYTPTVSVRDVRKENITTTPEDTFLANVTNESLAEWRPGKRFRVTDDKIRLIFGATASPFDSLGGSTLIFTGAKESPSITGTSVTDLSFAGEGGRTFVYRINRPLARVMDQETLNIPFTIQESLVDEARGLLQGLRLYVLTRTWRDDADNSVSGRQFVPVTIDSVTPGNDIYPVKVSFTDERGTSARIFLHPGPRGYTPRSFPVLFSFTNPRLKYPSVTDENWERIVNGRVALEMTRDECRLALGAPREVDRGADNSYIREVWLYENGIYLVFEDGILKRYRH